MTEKAERLWKVCQEYASLARHLERPGHWQGESIEDPEDFERSENLLVSSLFPEFKGSKVGTEAIAQFLRLRALRSILATAIERRKQRSLPESTESEENARQLFQAARSAIQLKAIEAELTVVQREILREHFLSEPV